MKPIPRSHQTITMTTTASEDIISVRPTLVIGGCISCFISVFFSILLVCLPPGPTSPETGALRFISNGMERYCGWSAVVLGTCSLFILMCQLVAAAHMSNHIAALCAIIQTIGWNVVLGAADTGWTVHYIGLVFFMLGGQIFHWLAGYDPNYGSLIYSRVNILASFFTIVFGVIGLVSMIDEGKNATLRSFAVSFEFVFMFFLAAQNMCIIFALDAYKDIHIRFNGYN